MQTATKSKRSSGRPKADIDWQRVGDMLKAGCAGPAIAASFGIHPNVLYSRCKSDNNLDFSELRHQKRAEGDDLLHEKQYEVAMSGDKVMLVWLGKQRLGQADKREIDHTINNSVDIAKKSIQGLLDQKVFETYAEAAEYVLNRPLYQGKITVEQLGDIG